jgi:gluconolactonase
MVRSFTMLLSCLLVFSLPAMSQKKPGLIAPGAELIKLAGGFGFTEGPAVDHLGNVYFTDQPNNKIHVWTINGHLETFLENSGRANGLYFDLNGNLLSCSDMDNQLWSISISDKSHTNLVLDYDGKKLNGPNDLWIHPGGGIYFTDPLYVRPYWTRNPAMQQDGEHVYYLAPDRKTVVRVATDLMKPNGIVGTPDGKTLYVADIGANKTYAYDILPDGNLGNKRLFTDLGSDGMTIDNKGNVYLTGDGVTIFNRKGKKIGHIPVDAPWTANVCFGGKEMKTLFITASDGLFAVELKIPGVSR